MLLLFLNRRWDKETLNHPADSVFCRLVTPMCRQHNALLWNIFLFFPVFFCRLTLGSALPILWQVRQLSFSTTIIIIIAPSFGSGEVVCTNDNESVCPDLEP